MKSLVLSLALFFSVQTMAAPSDIFNPSPLTAQQLEVLNWKIKEYPAKEAGNVRILITLAVETAVENCFLANVKLNLLKQRVGNDYVLTPFGFYQDRKSCKLLDKGASSIRFLMTTIEYDPNLTSSILIKGLEENSDINILQ